MVGAKKRSYCGREGLVIYWVWEKRLFEYEIRNNFVKVHDHGIFLPAQLPWAWHWAAAITEHQALSLHRLHLFIFNDGGNGSCGFLMIFRIRHSIRGDYLIHGCVNQLASLQLYSLCQKTNCCEMKLHFTVQWTILDKPFLMLWIVWMGIETWHRCFLARYSLVEM